MRLCKSIHEKVIIALSEVSYSMKLHNDIYCTQTSLIKIIGELKKEGIIKNSSEFKDNRTKLIELTTKGKKIRECLIKLKGLIGN